uniref:Retrovirus-related Pol polyprotein from transposon TNT 1-94 n=1 Tax=Cajanus cajan TaxID=3821 RepID=A0A151T4E8_CAJCA|nr:hypothetical protein KK1_016440 [Cajanus cajan]
MHNKFETAHHFIHFKNMVENQFGTKIKIFQYDGGKEFMCLTKVFNESGIIHRRATLILINQMVQLRGSTNTLLR